jgi:hypothetical protein
VKSAPSKKHTPGVLHVKSGWTAGFAVAGAEAGADLAGIGMLQVVKDGQGLLPGAAGGQLVSSCLAGVAEVGEDLGPAAAVAGVAVDVECLLVAGNGLGVIAQLVVGIAEAVQGGGLA